MLDAGNNPGERETREITRNTRKNSDFRVFRNVSRVSRSLMTLLNQASTKSGELRNSVISVCSVISSSVNFPYFSQFKFILKG
jgi:hypothetical protein